MIISIKKGVVVVVFVLVIAALPITGRSLFKRNSQIPKHETTKLESDSISKIKDLEAQKDELENKQMIDILGDRDNYLTLMQLTSLHSKEQTYFFRNEAKELDSKIEEMVKNAEGINLETKNFREWENGYWHNVFRHFNSTDIGIESKNIKNKQSKTTEEQERLLNIYAFDRLMLHIDYATTSNYKKTFNASQLKYWMPILKYLDDTFKYDKIITLAMNRCGFGKWFRNEFRSKHIIPTKTRTCTIDDFKTFVKIDIAIEKFKDWLFPEAAEKRIVTMKELQLKNLK